MDRLKRQERTAALDKQHLLNEIDELHDQLFIICTNIIDEDEADEAAQVRAKLEQALAKVHEASELVKTLAGQN